MGARVVPHEVNGSYESVLEKMEEPRLNYDAMRLTSK